MHIVSVVTVLWMFTLMMYILFRKGVMLNYRMYAPEVGQSYGIYTQHVIIRVHIVRIRAAVEDLTLFFLN